MSGYGNQFNQSVGGYQPPSGYHQPSGGYNQPPSGYHQPSGGYQPPSGYKQPSGGYNQPGYGAPLGSGAPPGIDPTIYQWFLSVDQDKSGRINTTELQQALTNANWTHFNPETCRLMIGMFDKDQSGQIDLNEFQGLWSYITQWKSTFDQYDRDRSGFIDANELHYALNTMGYKVSPQFAAHVVFRYDPMARQRLSLDNFIQACVLMKCVTDTFRQKDSQMQGTIQTSYEDFMTMVLLNKP